MVGCKCDKNIFGFYCNFFTDFCEEVCFSNVICVRGKGCEVCFLYLIGDGRYCVGELE